ncbi:MAG: BolA/IbaG family iron-sulfur metabolism protein [Gammaproteobacteria bacterium]|jgi:BolA protein|nr:BolA/IbaG family iron-sulfur metabolism protein [Gammaproteobacteria bacterium]
MSMQDTITSKLVAGFGELDHLEVMNESSGHNVPPGSESHFKVVLVSEDFVGAGLLARHRRVHRILADEMTRIHALSVHAYTPDEWRERTGGAPMSPPCMGGETGRNRAG